MDQIQLVVRHRDRGCAERGGRHPGRHEPLVNEELWLEGMRPGRFDEGRVITLLQNIPELMAVPTPVERKAMEM